jgi:hypothetical protein
MVIIIIRGERHAESDDAIMMPEVMPMPVVPIGVRASEPAPNFASFEATFELRTAPGN